MEASRSPRRARVSSPLALPGGVNDQCHGWTGHLRKNGGLVLSPPSVFVVYWDGFWTAAAINLMNDFFIDILAGGDWIDGLGQYGVSHGTLRGSVAIADPPPVSLTKDQLQQHLTTGLDDGTIPIRPASRETSLL